MSDYLSIAKDFGLQESNASNTDYLDNITYTNLKSGMGITIGNSIRRILLSKVPGYAIVSLKVAGVQHEFSVIQGVKEDVQQLIMNLKKVVFAGSESTLKASLNVSKSGEVYASDIVVASGEVVNKEVYLCSLEKGFEIKLELIIEKNIGVRQVNDKTSNEFEIGSIAIDAFFSPILSVDFKVNEQESSGLEDLVIEIITNGSITPKEAFSYSLNLLFDQLERSDFIKFVEKKIESSESEDSEESDFLSPNLYLKVEEVPGFSNRILSCFSQLEVVYIGDLVKFSKDDLLNSSNFWTNSLNTVVDVLASMGLELGMKIKWPPEDLEEKAKEISEKAVF